MILIVPAYRSADPARRGEIELCLRVNLGNPAIAHVVLVGDVAGLARYPKLTVVPAAHRPSYELLFGLAARWPGEAVAVANADIYFDATAAEAERVEVGELWALSRWSPQTGRIAASQLDAAGRECVTLSLGADAWVFRAPLPVFAVRTLDGVPFWLGRPFCDHRLARLAIEAGLRITNPCRSLRAWHAHASAVRTYTHADCIAGDYAHIPPCSLPIPAGG